VHSRLSCALEKTRRGFRQIVLLIVRCGDVIGEKHQTGLDHPERSNFFWITSLSPAILNDKGDRFWQRSYRVAPHQSAVAMPGPAAKGENSTSRCGKLCCAAVFKPPRVCSGSDPEKLKRAKRVGNAPSRGHKCRRCRKSASSVVARAAQAAEVTATVPRFEPAQLTADERDRLVERGAARTGVTHRGVLVPD
jgi:hypothetical protein